jgi:hypothetical protein
MVHVQGDASHKRIEDHGVIILMTNYGVAAVTLFLPESTFCVSLFCAFTRLYTTEERSLMGVGGIAVSACMFLFPLRSEHDSYQKCCCMHGRMVSHLCLD